MHNLIIKYFNKDITAEEKDLLFKLIATSPELRKEFNDAQNLYGLTAWLLLSGDRPYAVDKLLTFKGTLRKSKLISIFRHVLGYAAIVCMAVLGTWMWMDEMYRRSLENEVITYVEFSTPEGQRAKLKLHDGTKVWLNAKSTLRYPNRFVNNERHVELEGEAFFDVVQNKKIPFVVETEKVNIKVLGTKFNVFAYKGQPEVKTALVEGSVKLYIGSDEEQAFYLNPNEIAELKDGVFSKSHFDNTDFLLWKKGIYAFDDIPFTEILKKLELYYDIKIVVKNKRLENFHFSGKFRQRDGIERVLYTLQKVRYFYFTKDDDQNIIIIN